jgi:hypothetical protein
MIEQTPHAETWVDYVTHRQIAEVFGVTRRTIDRYCRDGIPLFNAETICDHIGVHPSEVWPDYHERALAYQEARAEIDRARRVLAEQRKAERLVVIEARKASRDRRRHRATLGDAA